MNVRNLLLTGTTRFGKSETYISKTCNKMLEREHDAFVIFDPAGSMTQKIAKFCVMNNIPLLYDKISDTGNVLGYPFYATSTNPDPDQREAENREMKSDSISCLMRAEGKLNAAGSQIIQEGLNDAFDLLISQRKPVHPKALINCFFRESDDAQLLLNNCGDPQVAFQTMWRQGLKGKDWEYQNGPAKRRLKVAFSCVQYRQRCVPTFDFPAFINSGGILLLDGSSQGNISREDVALIMGTLLLRIISMARSGRFKKRISIAVDEGMNSGLIDLNVGRALAESAKWGGGVEWTLITQNPLIANAELRDQIDQNTVTKYAFRQVSPDAAFYFAKKFATSGYDPAMVKKVETRIRMEHAGVRVTPIHHSSESKDEHGNKRTTDSESHITEPIFNKIEEQITHEFTGDEQERLWAQKLMNYSPGWCTVQDENTVVEVYIPMLKMPPMSELPWQLSPRISYGDFKLAEKLKELKTTLPYQSPLFQPTTKQRRSAME